MEELIYEPKRQLFEYLSNNYDTVIKPTKNGAYIEIDLIPNGHNGLHSIKEMVESCNELGIDLDMFFDIYPIGIGDGFRMGRYWYFMEKTTERILKEYNEYKNF